MSKSARRLGRGLDSLVSNLRSTATTHDVTAEIKGEPDVGVGSKTGARALQALMLPVDALNPNPFQPRDNALPSNVLSLAESIRQSGILQPIVVRRDAGRYQIIAGERRWRAARSLGMAEVPTLIREATDEQMLELALVENIQREDLNAIDRAKAYRQFCNRFGLKPEEVARRVGEDRTTVVNYLRLLDLSQAIQGLVAESKLSMGHARCLLGIADDGKRGRLAESAAQNDLSVRALEEIVRREKKRRGDGQPNEAKVERLRSPHVLDLQSRFEEAVKTKVTIQEGKRKGTGRIVIEYYSLDDFDRVAGMLGVMPE